MNAITVISPLLVLGTIWFFEIIRYQPRGYSKFVPPRLMIAIIGIMMSIPMFYDLSSVNSQAAKQVVFQSNLCSWRLPVYIIGLVILGICILPWKTITKHFKTK